MNMNINREEMKKEEYEYTFYGYSTREVIKELKDILTSATEQQTSALEQTLMKHYKDPEQQTALKKATDCFRSKCAESIAEGLPKLESLVHEMFGIPDHVLLPEHSVHREQYTEEDEKKLDDSIEQLTAKAVKTLFLQTCMKEELQDLKKIVSLEAKIKEQQQFHDHRSQVITEAAAKYCDNMISEVVEIKNSAKSLGLLRNEDIMADLIEKKFACQKVV